MRQNRTLVIVDIGSHKLEELLVLLGPFRRQLGIYTGWAVRRLLKGMLTLNVSILRGLGRQLRVIRYYFLSRRAYDLRVVCVEPNIQVAHPYVEKLSRKYPVHYIPAAVLGHDARETMELKMLFFYGPSISSSIYRKNRAIDDKKARMCIGLTFDVIWDGLVKEGIIGADDPFLLRMNCEGSELGVIKACARKRLKPLCVIGSLGDVDKIHGKETGDETRRIMSEMGTPYFYFKGDDPSTWHDMIPIWERYTRDCRKN